MIFGSDRKKCLKRIRGYDTGGRQMEVDALLIGNDKNNVIANKVLSYF